MHAKHGGVRVARYLGIDPGLRRCGWGVVHHDGARVRAIDHGVITPPTDAPFAQRLADLFNGVSAVIREFEPDAAAIEETFVNANPASALKLGHARAAAMLAPACVGLHVDEFAPSVIKKSVTGSGRAEKEQVAAMLRVLMPGVTAAGDAADALAVAVCCAHHAPARAL